MKPVLALIGLSVFALAVIGIVTQNMTLMLNVLIMDLIIRFLFSLVVSFNRAVKEGKNE